jgi:hypothetical protein
VEKSISLDNTINQNDSPEGGDGGTRQRGGGRLVGKYGPEGSSRRLNK